jgi:hypothetical protein
MGLLPSPVPCFRIGDRVRLLTPVAGVAAGSLGTVMYRFLGALLYDVRFDGEVILRVIEERKLTPAPPESRRRFSVSP